jgi:hypothetical protein
MENTTQNQIDSSNWKGEKIDWSKINIDSFLNNNVTSTPVICKDGTTKNQPSSPNAKYADVCRDNGGRAENQTISVKQISEEVKLENSKIGIGKYKVNKTTSIFKKNPNKKDIFGDVGTDIIGTLNDGDVVEVAKLGGGGRGVIMTPYLIFNDGSYIIGYDADKVDNSTPITLTPQSFIEKNKTNLLIAGAIVLGYFAYKKFIK